MISNLVWISDCELLVEIKWVAVSDVDWHQRVRGAIEEFCA
jgi:hypothetical protein